MIEIPLMAFLGSILIAYFGGILTSIPIIFAIRKLKPGETPLT